MKFFIVLISVLNLSNAALSFDFTGTIPSDGITRNFMLHTAGTSVQNNLPVVIILHGDGGSGQGMKNGTAFDAAADVNNFMAVYPSSTNQLGNGIWNKQIDGNYAGEPNDVLFISDLIDHLCQTYHINPNKVYVTGHSGGGFMAYHLAVALNIKIAAFAPVAGSMYDANGGTFLSNYLSGGSFVKVPICHIHGDDDGVVSYPDSDEVPVDYQEWPLTGFSPVTCGNTTYDNATITTIVTGVQRIPFCENGANSKEVVLIRLLGKGHEWPNVANFNVEQFIWDFCNAYQLNTGVSCAFSNLEESNASIKLNLFPNPTSSLLNVELFSEEMEIQLIDLTGNVLLVNNGKTGINKIDVSQFESAIYLLKVSDNKGNVIIRRFHKD